MTNDDTTHGATDDSIERREGRERIPANIGVPPEAANATHADDDGLADGPPATNEELRAHPTPGSSQEQT